MGKIQSPPAMPCRGGRHKHMGVLPGALRELLVPMLSPPQSWAAFGMMPDTLAWMDHCTCEPPMGFAPPSQQGCQYCTPSFVSWSLIQLWWTKSLLRCRNKWQSLCASFGLDGGCSKISHFNYSCNMPVLVAVCICHCFTKNKHHFPLGLYISSELDTIVSLVSTVQLHPSIDGFPFWQERHCSCGNLATMENHQCWAILWHSKNVLVANLERM